MESYGAYGEKVLYGKKTSGVIRSTVWNGPDDVGRKLAREFRQLDLLTVGIEERELGRLLAFRGRHAAMILNRTCARKIPRARGEPLVGAVHARPASSPSSSRSTSSLWAAHALPDL
jgi:hypothetical protein